MPCQDGAMEPWDITLMMDEYLTQTTLQREESMKVREYNFFSPRSIEFSREEKLVI